MAMKQDSFKNFVSRLMGKNLTGKTLRRAGKLKHLELGRSVAVEHLETRVLPAATINVIQGLAGTGTQDANLADGTINFADADIGGNTITTGELEALAQNSDILIQASQINFGALGGTITLQTGSGHSVTFSTDTAGGTNITFASPSDVFATSGGSLTFDAGTNLTLANLNSGGSDVNLTAGSRGAGNINAQSINAGATGNLSFSAINAGGGTITQTGAAAGLAVNAIATGDIVFDSLRGVSTVSVTSNTGSISSLASNGYQANQLNLSAVTGINVVTHATSGLVAHNSTSGDLIVNQDAGAPTALTILSGGVSNSAVGGAVTINNAGGTAAGASLTLNGPVSAIGGDVTLGATNGITLNNGVGVVTTLGGNYVANADLDASGNGVYTQLGTASVDTVIGDATVIADDVDLVGTITAGVGIVTIANGGAGVPINIGATTPAATLNLSTTEIDQILSASVIRIGSGTAGLVTIGAGTTLNPANSSVVHLIGGDAGITQDSTSAITVPNLAITSSGAVGFGSNNFNDIDNLAASITGAGALSYQDSDAAGFTVGVVDGLTGITSANDSVTLYTDALNVVQPINAGTGRVIISSFTNGIDFDLGTNTAGKLSLTQADIDLITAGTLQLGDSYINHLTVTAAALTVNAAQVPNLVLSSSIDIDDVGVGYLVANNVLLRTSNFAFLDNSGTDLKSLAATVSGAFVAVVDANGLIIDNVDGVNGIQAPNANVTLTAGGAVTQTAAGVVNDTTLDLHGSGSFTLNNPANTTGTIASITTGAVSYTDANSLTIGTVNAVNGMTTTNSNISVDTVNGALTVSQAVNAGTASVALTAGSSANDNLLAINNVITGAAGIVLTGDNIDIANSVGAAGTARVTLQPFEAGTLINIGGADAAGTLGITLGELNGATANVIQVGNATAGNLINSVVVTPTGTAQLELVTGGGILDGVAGLDYVVDSLALTAGTGIGIAGPDSTLLDISVHNLEAAGGSGGVSIANVSSTPAGLVIGGVTATLNGVASGDYVEIHNTGNAVNSGDITVNEGVSATGSGGVSLFANDGSPVGASLVINAPVSETSTGGVYLQATNGVTVNSAVSSNTGSILVAADFNADGIGDFTNTAAGTLTTAAANVTVTAADVDLGGNITAGSGSVLTLRPSDTASLISLGTDVGFGITDADLDQVTAGTVHIGGGLDAGGIAITGAITAPPTYQTLSLETTGAVTDSFAGEATEITVPNLAIRAGLGIGAADNINTAVSTLAFTNGAGAVNIDNTGALDLNSVDGINAITNTGTTTTVSAHSPVTVSIPVSSAGDVTLTAGESAASGDDLTVNAAVTSLTGSVFLNAGDTVTINSPISALTATKTVTVVGGAGDIDGVGGITLNSDINSATVPTLLGGPGATEVDTFNINQVTGTNIAATGLNVDGNGGNDIYNVTFAPGVFLGTVNINDTGATAGDVLNVTGLATDDVVNYDSNGPGIHQLTVNGHAVNFPGVDSVTIDALGAANDSLFIAENQPGLAGDAAGLAAIIAGQPYTFASPGGVPVTFSNFETFNFQHSPPVVTLTSVTNPVNEGSLVSLVVNINDPDNNIGQTYTATINWGDGTPPDVQTFIYTGPADYTFSHAILDDNPTGTASDPDTISFQVKDDNADVTTLVPSPTITVNNVAPVITSSSLPFLFNVAEGQTITFTSTFFDPGLADTFTVDLDWGDSSPHQTVSQLATPGAFTDLGGGNWSFSVSHTFLDDNPTGTNSDLAAVDFTVTDDDTGSASFSSIYLISNVVPVIDTLVVTPSQVDENGSVTVTGTFSDVGVNDTHTATIDWGDGTAPTPVTITEVLGSGTGSFTATHQYLDDTGAGPSNAFAITLTLMDDDNGVVTASRSVQVNDVAPVVTITGAPLTSPEGTPITVTGSFVSDVGTLDTIVAHNFTVTKDGVAYTSGTGTGLPGDLTSDFTFTPDDNGVYVVTFGMTDNDGLTGTDSATINVTNVAPTVTIVGAPATSPEGTPITLTSTVTDPGTADTDTYAWSVTKDGVLFATGTAADFTFTPDDNGTYVVSLTATDDDGDVSNTDTATITVTNVAPVINTLILTPVVDENGFATLSGTYSDAGTADTETLTIDWGDGTAPQTVAVTGGTFNVTHQYLNDVGPGTPNTLSVTATLTDDDGGSFTSALPLTISVNDVSPVIDSLSLSQTTINENDTVTLNGTYHDVGSQDTQTLTIIWGDGSAPETTAVSGGAFSLTHQYLDDNPSGSASDLYTISVNLADNDGLSVNANATLQVNDVAPVATIVGAPATSPEGTAISLTSTVTDVGTLDTFTYAWSVTKNGVPYAVATPTNGTAFSFTPTDNGTYVVTLDATDDDTLVGSTSATINVTNVAPTIDSVNVTPTTINENDTVTLTGTYSDVGTSDTQTLTINWGDGTALQTVAVSGGVFNVTHQYLDDNPTATASDVNNISLTLTDDDGDTATDNSLSVTVNDVAPTVAIFVVGGSAAGFEGTPIALTSDVHDVGTLDTQTYAWSVTKNGAAFTTGTPVTGTTFGFTPDDNGTYVVTLTVTDDDGLSTAATTTIVVADVAPVITTLNVTPTSILENGSVTVTGTYSDVGAVDSLPGNAPTVTIVWGDGQTSTATVNTVAKSFTATHTYLDDNPTGTSSDLNTITATVTDKDGLSASQSVSVLVSNVAPVATIVGAPATSPEGTTINLTSTVTDVGTLDTFTYNWSVLKNGIPYSTGTPTNASSFSFTPNDNGVYVVNLTVADDDLLTSTTSSVITVTNVSPALGALVLSSSTVNENGSVTLSGTYTDPGAIDTETLTINWGDGSVPTSMIVTGNTFSVTHQYLDDNPTGTPSDLNVISVTITDNNGGTDSATASVTVNNVAPTATIVGAPVTSPEGSPINLTSTVTDPGTLDTITKTWSVTKNAVAFAAGTGATFSFTPDDNGTYVVTFTATDDDTGVGTDTKTITVNNVAPTVGITGPTQGVACQPLTYTLTATDPSQLDTNALFTFNIDWDGDGTIDQTVVGASGTKVTHIYETPATDVISVTATDVNGGVSAPATVNVTISNLAVINGVLEISGTSGDDVIKVTNGKHGDLIVTLNKVKIGTFNPARDHFNSIAIYGCDGNDTISVPKNLTLPVSEYGGNGNDTLIGGARNDYLDGGAGDDKIYGNKGNDIMVGGDGNDYLNGGPGKDFMIGGAGMDVLFGEGVGDLLVGSATSHDGDRPALENILKEWTSAALVLSIDNRVANIKAGTGDTEGATLNPASANVNPGIDVLDDGAVDELHTVQGANWVIKFVTDKLFGSKKYDNTNRIN
jgi:hypothetical protein